MQAPEKTTTPTLDEVRRYCSDRGVPERDAEWFFYKCEGNGWTNGGRKIKSWTATIMSWKSAGYLPSQKQSVNGSGTDKMILAREYDRVLARMQVLKATYGDHQTWDPKDREEFRKLKARRDELRGLLGILI